MGRQGKPMTKEEGDLIIEYIEKKICPNVIATKLKRSSNCVYTFIRKNNLSGKVAIFRPKGKVVDAERPPEDDLSKLPDTVLFKQINYAIP